MPMATDVIGSPSNRSGRPKMKRGLECSGSSPTVAHNRPKIAAMMPFASDFPIRPAITAKAKMSRQTISIGPIIRATRASGGDTVISTMSLKVSPVTDE